MYVDKVSGGEVSVSDVAPFPTSEKYRVCNTFYQLEHGRALRNNCGSLEMSFGDSLT